MGSAQDFVSLIRNMVREEINKLDKVTPAIVVSYSQQTEKADITLLTDDKTIIRGIENFSKFVLYPGDTVYVYLIQNRLSDSFIIGRQGGIQGTPTIIQY